MSDNIRQALKRLHDWALVMAGGCKFSGDHPIAQAAAALGQPKPLCPLCGYPHGHAIGCKNNPVDIALRALNAPAQPDPVAWGVWDSQGFYAVHFSEDAARAFCDNYNGREDRAGDPLRPYTFAPLFAAPAPAQPEPQGEREAFEAWARGPAGYVDDQLARHADGSYQDSTTRLHWSVWHRAWQARAALAAPAHAQPEPVEEGWRWVRVNAAFNPLVKALARASLKGYIPDAMADEWEAFDWQEPHEAAHGIKGDSK